MNSTLARSGQRELNSGQILRAIVREGPLSRVALAHLTGLTTAAISNITRELIDIQLLRELGPSNNKRVGARAILLDLPQDVPVIGVVHQGVSALRVGLCNLHGRVLGRRAFPTPEPLSPEEVVSRIGQALDDLLTARCYPQEALIGIGAGMVGLADAERGVIKRAPRLGWEDVQFRDLLLQRYERPIVVENNVRAMAYGEALFGAGRAWSDFAFVYVGTGIGSGLIIAGRPYHGAHQDAGEIGHIVVEPRGERCACGNNGCLETVAAEPALVRRSQQRGVSLNSAQTSTKEAVLELATLAAQGDATARELIKTCGESLGMVLATVVDLYDPSRIVVHGAITAAGEVFFSAISQYIHQRAFLARNEVVTLATPTFGNDAGLVGAAALALDAIVLSGSVRDTLRNFSGAASSQTNITLSLSS